MEPSAPSRTTTEMTPAVGGLYFLGVRRWGTVVFSAVVFFATIGVSALVVGDQTRYYFTELLGDAGRVGPIGTSFNQSWRGGISRILGHDAGYGPLVVAAIVVTAALALLAWRAVGTNDRLGGIVVVQLFGLLLSPISWTHHWVWVLPLMIWLLHGPLRQRLGARILGWGWLALTLVGVPWLLSFAQPTIWEISRPQMGMARTKNRPWRWVKAIQKIKCAIRSVTRTIASAPVKLTTTFCSLIGASLKTRC